MNIHVDTGYLASLHAAHKARQQRLWHPRIAKKSQPVIREMQDAHIVTWRQWRMDEAIRKAAEHVAADEEMLRAIEERAARRSVAEIVAEVINDTGFTFDDIRGQRRARSLIAVRHAAIQTVAAERPDLSAPALGRFFCMDHTSILHALGRTRKAQRLRAAHITPSE